MEIKMLAPELEQWARRITWKKATQLITEHHRGNLLSPLAGVTDVIEFSRLLHNNTQIIKRAFRGDTPTYRRHAAVHESAVRAAMDAEQSQHDDTWYRVAIANRECIEATAAVLLGKPVGIIQKETIEAIHALAVLLPGVTVQVTRGTGCGA